MKSPTIAQVVLGVPVEGPFDYFIPDAYQGIIKVGMRVEVPFGTRRQVGYVTNLSASSTIKKIKSINKVLDAEPILGVSFLQWTKSFSEYYGCSWGEAIDNALPQPIRMGRAVKLEGEKVFAAQGGSATSTLVIADNIKHSWSALQPKIKSQIDAKRGILILVPETIYLQPLKELFQKDFPQAAVSYQENLSAKEQIEQWTALKNRCMTVAAGVISNIFAPVQDLGLIVVVDEENPLYKHEQTPFYHVRQVALIRQKIENCDVIFVSAAPNAELWHQAHQQKWMISNLWKFDVHHPHESGDPDGIALDSRLRGNDIARAKVSFIDLSNFKSRGAGYVSLPLQGMIEKTLANKGRIILFLNRRGFSSLTLCQFCGFIFKCPRCSTTLMVSYEDRLLSCRHCTHKEPIPKDCPRCGKHYLKSLGSGVEKIESDMKRIFPQVRVGYVDKTTKSFPQNSDLLIATQAIFKWKEKIKAHLVAALDIDAEFNRQDFRSSNRAFSLGIHLIGLAKETCVFQTHDYDSYVLKALKAGDHELFYKKELFLRKELNLPPFEHLLAVALRSRNENSVRQYAGELYNHLCAQSVAAHEPGPDVPAKLRDQFRFVIICHGKRAPELVAHVKDTLKTFKRKVDVVVTLNVDP